jgi:hypothetical protein
MDISARPANRPSNPGFPSSFMVFLLILLER